LEVFYILETKSLLSLTDVWSSQLIINTISTRIETRKVVESLRESTFLEKSLLVIIFGIVVILGFEPIFFFSFFSKEDKAIALEDIFLETEEASYNITSLRSLF